VGLKVARTIKLDFGKLNSDLVGKDRVRAAARHAPSKLVQIYVTSPDYEETSLLFERCYGQVSSGRLMTIGVAVLRTTTHRNGSSFEGLISICGRKAGT